MQFRLRFSGLPQRFARCRFNKNCIKHNSYAYSNLFTVTPRWPLPTATVRKKTSTLSALPIRTEHGGLTLQSLTGMHTTYIHSYTFTCRTNRPTIYEQSNGGHGMYVSGKLQDGLPNRSTLSQWSSYPPGASFPRGHQGFQQHGMYECMIFLCMGMWNVLYICVCRWCRRRRSK